MRIPSDFAKNPGEVKHNKHCQGCGREMEHKPGPFVETLGNLSWLMWISVGWLWHEEISMVVSWVDREMAQAAA